mmetsp:Transcript_74420/g.209840  ORF Transcript_74420/g.209840 Transcript_74420/m.209840 type:complete len:224 (-) Transcript_74420:1452-2123(-)
MKASCFPSPGSWDSARSSRSPTKSPRRWTLPQTWQMNWSMAPSSTTAARAPAATMVCNAAVCGGPATCRRSRRRRCRSRLQPLWRTAGHAPADAREGARPSSAPTPRPSSGDQAVHLVHLVHLVQADGPRGRRTTRLVVVVARGPLSVTTMGRLWIAHSRFSRTFPGGTSLISMAMACGRGRSLNRTRPTSRAICQIQAWLQSPSSAAPSWAFPTSKRSTCTW